MRSAYRRFACAIVTLVWASAAIAAEGPNVVLIFVDDLGYGDVAPYDPSIEYTPHIEALANEGVRFTDFYATALCSASRRTTAHRRARAACLDAGRAARELVVGPASEREDDRRVSRRSGATRPR